MATNGKLQLTNNHCQRYFLVAGFGATDGVFSRANGVTANQPMSKLRFSCLAKFLVCIGCVLLCADYANASKVKKKTTKDVAEALCPELLRLGLHKVYVTDFVDVNGKTSGVGQFVAASLARDLGDRCAGVADRVQMGKVLAGHHWSNGDLANSRIAAQLALETGIDGMISGVVSAGDFPQNFRASLIVRDAAYKQLLQERFDQTVTAPIFGILAATRNDDLGSHPNFAGLDGISAPMCKSCPNPEYSKSAFARKIQGNVSVYVLVSEQGDLTNPHIVESIPDLDGNAIKALKSWKLTPGKNSDGTPLPTWVAIEIAFRFRP